MRPFRQIRREFERVTAAWYARWRKPVLRALRCVIPIILLAILGRSLTQIGWLHVWNARPGALSFYAILFLQFFIQPTADLVIYRSLLCTGRTLGFTVLLRKRFLNCIMLDYSGEAYFYFWARQHLDTKEGVLLHAVKDSSVLSAGSGFVLVWLTLLAVVAGGIMKLPAIFSSNAWTFFSIGSFPLVLCLALVFGGRRVTTLSRGQIATTFAIHLARGVLTLLFEFALWWLSGALPSAAVCLEFVALRLLVTRLPLIPNKDLIFVGVGIAAAGLMDLSAPRVAAVLVIMTAFGQIQEFGLVGLPWFFEQFRAARGAGHAAS